MDLTNLCSLENNLENSKVWSVTETKYLLEVYEKLMKTKQYKKRKSLWLDVSIHMKSNYINVSSSQCENRWKALKVSCSCLNIYQFTYVLYWGKN